MLSRQKALNVFFGISTPVVVVLIAFAVSSVLVFFSGYNPAQVIASIFLGAFGSSDGIASTLNLMSILILTGLSALIAFKCQFWNIGGEGQLYVGAIGAILIGLSNIGSFFIHPVLTLLAAIVFGSFWGLIPALLKVKLQVNEVVSTILLNFIAFLLVDYLVSRPLRDPTLYYNQSFQILGSAKIPFISDLSLGIVPAILAAILIYILIGKTPLGFEISLVGGNPVAANYGGVKAGRTTILAMIVSGGLAGLAGGLIITGESFRLMVGISRDYGYVGIGVAMLASLSSLPTIPSAIFFSTLVTGGIAMQRQVGIPYSFVNTMMAVVILVITTRHIIARRMSRTRLMKV